MTLPRTPSFRLDGKRALVAGGSRGIGLGCAVAMAEAGAEVTVVARGAEAVETAAAAMRAEGWAAAGRALDITDHAALRDFLGKAPPFDILINSAGLARHSPALDTRPEDYDAVMRINVRAAYFLAQEVARGMVGRGGSIIQISSQMGHVGGPDRAVYCASKHAVEGMTKAMAIEWGPSGIRVNTVCPTFILTDLTRPTFEDPEKRAWIESKIKLGRVGEVEDIMGACVFLASDASALVTGTSILVDGGWTAE
ncbi:SDR family NAD(P)-dependent oxidoreductase [Aestuariicoccus sp. MJ-SS9]|uniref:SDR family NAD(P)-dependent oxidoreductase n=1 Tax=Aestuariicoccus sp. MJ-SS9 TaxID=3079855 RepID=UPI00290C6634|nr:SDR family oxidoreductase [Aestuariicoccus sp. MJ-SS9]MDU8910276.1 SDR family oxidoreductase [Aestuariicoccus sp. MJ-SS9]